MRFEIGDIVRITPEAVIAHFAYRELRHGDSPMKFPLSHPLLRWLGNVTDNSPGEIQVKWFYRPKKAHRSLDALLNENQEDDAIKLYEVKAGC